MIRTSGWRVGVIALCTVLSALAQERPSDFASHWPLATEGAAPWYRLELPLSAQLATRQGDLGDLRIFDSAGQSMPYTLQRDGVAHEYRAAQAGVKWFPLYDAIDLDRRVPNVRVQLAANGSVSDVQPGEELEAGEEILRGWLLDTSAIKAPLIHLNFDWTSEREGFQHFTIEASDDFRQWQAWGDGQVGRFSFADERIEQHDVDLAGKPARYLRLLWTSPQAAPILSSVQITSDLSKGVAQPLSWSEPLVGRSDKANEYTWQLPLAVAVERIKVLVEQSNSLAPVAVLGRHDANASWQLLQNGLLYRLSQNGQDFVQDQFALPGQTVRQIMLQVDDRGGGLGNGVPQLQVAARPLQVLFKAGGAGPFSLALGSATRPGQRMLVPNDAELAGIAQAHIVDTAPGKALAPAQASATSANRAGFNPTHVALWLGLSIVALACAMFALVLGRQRSTRVR